MKKLNFDEPEQWSKTQIVLWTLAAVLAGGRGGAGSRAALTPRVVKDLWSSTGALASGKKSVTLTHGQLQAAPCHPLFPPRTAAFFFDHGGALVFVSARLTGSTTAASATTQRARREPRFFLFCWGREN
jgi:hypothetical protein